MLGRCPVDEILSGLMESPLCCLKAGHAGKALVQAIRQGPVNRCRQTHSPSPHPLPLPPSAPFFLKSLFLCISWCK